MRLDPCLATRAQTVPLLSVCRGQATYAHCTLHIKPSRSVEIMSSTIDICQHIYDAATDLLQLLGEDIEEEREDRTDPTHAPRLLLASPTKPLVIDLIARGCSSAIAADLDHVYTREMQRLRSRLEDSLERDYRTALSIGKHADQNAVAQLLDALRGTYQKSMQGIAESCREQVLRLLDERGTKSGSIEASGFSEEALCILGAAWERSQSVNAGDCRALASATGLRPAQIQRWVRPPFLSRACN